MNNLCNACTLRHNIEKNRMELNEMIQNRDHKLLDEVIISKSQSLDALVHQCIFCNNYLNRISELEFENVFGNHSTFYYYGEHHLFTTIYFYILGGVKNNELIYISMEDKLYQNLIQFLANCKVPLEHVKYRDGESLMTCNQFDGLSLLKDEIANALLEKEVEYYSGIRWIGQPPNSIYNCSQQELKDFENTIAEALSNTRASLLYIHDAYEYMNHVNSQVLKNVTYAMSH